MDDLKEIPAACQSHRLRHVLPVLGLIVVVMSPGMARSQHADWTDVRDDFLHGDPDRLQIQCERGAEANQQGLSAFNDAWVRTIQKLRFEAGVATAQPDSSNVFFKGLSAAMSDRCSGVW